MRWTRRKWLMNGSLAMGTMAVIGSAWVATSHRRSARFLRELARDAVRRIPPAPVRPEPPSWPQNRVTVCWLGHASVLINFYGLNVLVDPVFSARVGIGVGLGTLGPKRFVRPALPSEQLPDLDLVLLTHAHMDHLDLPSLRRLPAGFEAVTARDTLDLLADTPARRARELGWGESTVLRGPKGDIEVAAFEVKHWGRRWPSEKSRGYNGYVLRREGCAVLVAGDTAYLPWAASLRGLGPFAAAIMPIAAYNPWIRNHCTPEQAVAMADMAEASRIVPVHHQTFKLSDEPLREPLDRLEAALRGSPDRLALRQVGESVTL